MVNAMTATESRWQVVLGMPVAGLLWSLATLIARGPEVVALGIPMTEALVYISLGGMAQTLLLWVGFTFVLWAMARAFGGRVAILRLLALVSGSAPVLWAGAPATAYWIYGTAGQTAIAATLCLTALAFFLRGLAKALAIDLGWPASRAAAAVATATIFLASFTFLAI
ncbi:hypothetical protein [Roseovarius nitratireducens]|uniref:hypothetical protein n=1 Tax=Roseovarius nitratireducens TaxID=2044597 RepID=UPI00197D0B19|nr:hypothetical protein [Roseovarius nitratireducens]